MSRLYVTFEFFSSFNAIFLFFIRHFPSFIIDIYIFSILLYHSVFIFLSLNFVTSVSFSCVLIHINFRSSIKKISIFGQSLKRKDKEYLPIFIDFLLSILLNSHPMLLSTNSHPIIRFTNDVCNNFQLYYLTLKIT